MDGIGHDLEALSEGQPFDFTCPIVHDYFTLYNTNALFIGRVKDHDLRKLIVSTYSRARGLIDAYRLNNDLVAKNDYAAWLYQETKNQVHQSSAVAKHSELTGYAAELKKGHLETKKLVQDLLRALRKQGVLSQ